MFNRERYASRDFADLHHKLLSADLFQYFHVSQGEIRKNFQELAEAGRVFRMHHNAIPPFPPHDHQISRSVNSYTQMKILAQKAASLIKNGMGLLTRGRASAIPETPCISRNQCSVNYYWET